MRLESSDLKFILPRNNGPIQKNEVLEDSFTRFLAIPTYASYLAAQ